MSKPLAKAKIRIVASKKQLYRVRFLNEGKIFELYVRQVTQGSLFGFIELTDIVWGSKSQVIVDPSEQELKNEFAGVTRIHIPMHAVMRVDEVDKSTGAKIIPLKGGAERAAEAAPFPIYTPASRGPEKGR